MNISCLCDETVSHRSLNVVIIKMNHICMMYVRESDNLSKDNCVFIIISRVVIINLNLKC